MPELEKQSVVDMINIVKRESFTLAEAEELVELEAQRPKLIVRVKTSVYQTKNGFKFDKTLTILKRKSQLCGCDFQDVIVDMGITNLDDVEDGVYELKPHWERDWEGDWDIEHLSLVRYYK